MSKEIEKPDPLDEKQRRSRLKLVLISLLGLGILYVAVWLVNQLWFS